MKVNKVKLQVDTVSVKSLASGFSVDERKEIESKKYISVLIVAII